MAGKAIGRCGSVVILALALAGPVVAQPNRYGAVPDVPLNPAGSGWTGQGWTGPETRDGRDLRPDAGQDVRADDPHGPPAYRGHYVRPYRGWTLPSYFTAPPFAVRDYPRWGLGVPGIGRRWVRYYDDAVLVGPDGRVDDVRPGVDWTRDGARHGGADWSDDGVTYGGHRGGHAPGTVVTTTTPGTVTTTTVTEEIISYRAPKRTARPARTVRMKTWRAPAKRWSK